MDEIFEMLLTLAALLFIVASVFLAFSVSPLLGGMLIFVYAVAWMITLQDDIDGF